MLAYGTNPNYIVAKSLSIFTIIVLIPALFYSYFLYTKKSILFLDVICFYVTVTCSQLVFYHFINLECAPIVYTYLSVLLLLVELACYLTFTFHPLKNFLFKDPITKKYGLDGHPCHHHHKH